jgi:phosphoenolpyruvate-protein phosphotransferase (PTS system enzyme I)
MIKAEFGAGTSMRERKIQGIGVSPGIVIAEAVVHARKRVIVRPRPILSSQIDAELARFDKAIGMAEKAIRKVAQRVKKRLGSDTANIFEAHLLMLEDPMLIDRTKDLIRFELLNSDFALLTSMTEIQKAFSGVKDEFFRQRLADLEDVGRRLIENIQHTRGRSKKNKSADQPHIIFAEDLSPSEAACLDVEKVLGLVTEKGSPTSHTAILCRSVGVPAIVGLDGVLEKVKDGDLCVLDGNSGTLVIEPVSQTVLEFSNRKRDFNEFFHGLDKIHDEKSITADGHEIELSCNIELPVEIEHVIQSGSNGIGLYRTEYLFLAGDSVPNEETQYEEYIKAAKSVYPERVIIRTFDLGGDKQPSGMKFPEESNPFLGWRAIRVSLDKKKMFRSQLRAILRASTVGNVQLMFPMISGVSQLQEALDVLEQVKIKLRESGIPFDEQIKIGIMIEVPSAVIVAQDLAKMVDFFSIGTNDLTQYTLAVDRNNHTVAHLYDSLHPAILRSIHMTIQAARKENVWVGLCGELASDPSAVLLLIGLGLDELSVSPVILPEIKMMIRTYSLAEAQEFAHELLKKCDVKNIRAACNSKLEDHFKGIPLWRPYISENR